MAAKWPPRSYSDQCSIRWAGSIRARIVVSAAKTATAVGGRAGASQPPEPPSDPPSDPAFAAWAANSRQARIPS